MRNLSERSVARQMPVTVVDALEPVDVDHQAGHGSGVPLRTRQFFLQALLQVPPIVPARQEIRDASAQQARSVDRILDAHGAHGAQVRQKVRSMMTSEARRIAAAEAQRAGYAIIAAESNQRATLQHPAPGL